MTCVRLSWRCAVLLLCLVTGGCIPGGDNPVDEQSEPHYLTGKNKVSAMDWPGAIESFEQALEVNPRNASAHFELGWLYEEKTRDYAAAIHHYQCYLKLRPNSDKSLQARSRIEPCKMELSKTVSILPAAPTAQRELEKALEKLTLENRELKAQLAQWQAYYVASRAAATNAAQASQPAQSHAGGTTPPLSSGQPTPDATTMEQDHAGATPTVVSGGTRARPVSSTTRSHVVRSGETATSVARKYGITVTALLAANPQVKQGRLLAGQTLRIPGP